MYLIFALHNHQPVGNFGFVFEQAYRDGYEPFLDLVENFPDLRFSLHLSGSLLEWLQAERPQYVQRLRNLISRGQVELLGGAYYEPILAMLPRRDRLGQVARYREHLQQLFDTTIQGAWLAERVWEQELASDLAQAGITFTLLDDFHFRQAGVPEQDLCGYFLTEDQGRLLRIFPISEPLRYLVPWKEPQESIEYLRQLHARKPNAVAVCADDGEKFGVWPETHEHCYRRGWLHRWFELLMQNRDWLQLTSFRHVLETQPPVGLVYLPDCSYREMTEWALPPQAQRTLLELKRQFEQDPRWPQLRTFLRGGFWRNFLARYPEVREMYGRMREVSELVAQAEAQAHPEIEQARLDLYRGQVNCPYWHGAFGGLYLPHLRQAVYHHLIRAETRLRTTTEAEVRTGDWNCDGQQELSLINQYMRLYIAPEQGGSIYEWDIYPLCHNLLATLNRRPESYHWTILEAAGVSQTGSLGALHEQVKFKHPELHKLLYYDRYHRKSLLEHIYPAETTLQHLIRLEERDLIQAVHGRWSWQIEQTKQVLRLILLHEASLLDRPIRLIKTLIVPRRRPVLEVQYRCENLPAGTYIFASEWNFAGLAPDAEDRYYWGNNGGKLARLGECLELEPTTLFGLADDWLGLRIAIRCEPAAAFWAFPIQTVSQSEGGFELVYQSSAVLPHWQIQTSDGGEWFASITFQISAREHRS
jgi:alpha-amylase/alpha-mannosidase (GH57 family)